MLHRYIVYLIIAHYVHGLCCQDVPDEKRGCCKYNFGQTKHKSAYCSRADLSPSIATVCQPVPQQGVYSVCYQVQDFTHCYPKHCNVQNGKCIVTTGPSTYDQSKCPYNYARTEAAATRTWYPARRADVELYGIGEFMVDEIGKDYGTVVDKDIVFDEQAILQNNCLSQEGGVLTAVPCDKKIQRSCWYGSLKENAFGYCNQHSSKCFNADFNTSSLKCLCVQDISQWCTLANHLLDLSGGNSGIRDWCQNFFNHFNFNPAGILDVFGFSKSYDTNLEPRINTQFDVSKTSTNLQISKSTKSDGGLSESPTSSPETQELSKSSRVINDGNTQSSQMKNNQNNLQSSRMKNDDNNLESSRMKNDDSTLLPSRTNLYTYKPPKPSLFGGLECKVCEQEFPYVKPTYNFINTDNILELTFTHYKSLVLTERGRVFCMTDGLAHGLVRRLNINEQLSRDQLIVRIVAKNSGNYWCEAFEVKEFQRISTNQIWINAENVYPIEIVVRYDPGEDPTRAGVAYDKYIKAIQDAYNSNNYHYATITLNISVKWMKTVLLDQSKHEVTYLLHVCRRFGWDYHEKYYWQLSQNLPEVLHRQSFIVKFSKLYSTLYCMQQTDYQQGVTVTWPQTLIKHPSDVVCIGSDGNPVTRQCGGDIFIGGRWEQANACISEALDESEVTHDLNETLHSNLTTPEIIHNLTELTADVTNYKPIDVYLVSSILLKAKPEDADPENITRILNMIMSADQNILRQSQSTYNATDRILYSFDLILSANKYQQTDYLLETDNLISFTFDANATDYAGLALYRESEDFEVLKLLRNASLENLMVKPGLEVVTYFPDVLLDFLAAEHPKIIINIFLNSALFNDNERKSVARNFGILLDDNGTLPENITLLFKPDEIITTQGACGFWNYGFDVDDKPMFGKWDIDYDAVDYKSLQRCEFGHVTHFGLLISGKVIIEDTYILELITNVESILSLVGFSGIFVTAACFKTWRGNRGNRILLHYSFISFLQIALLYMSQMIYKGGSYFLCVIIGAGLHFTVISQFCWMLVISYLQYKRYVTVFQGSQKFMLVKAFAISYFFPIVPISLLLVFYMDSYTKGTGELCYPTGYGLMFSVLVPISVVLFSNIVIFVRIVSELFCLRRNKCVDDDIFLLRLRLVVLMFFMLGITWALGFAAQFFESPTLLYAFCSTATLQGFVIFLFFIVFNKNTRIMYVYMWKKYNYW